jgi:hypothetical protein
MPEERNNSAAVPRRCKRRWLYCGLSLAVIFLVVVAVMQSVSSSSLRESAKQISVGDSHERVKTVMGKPQFGYATGNPALGQPVLFHQVYGGPVNRLRGLVDSQLGLQLRGLPKWYLNYVWQAPKQWPVRVEFDADQKVSAVFF